MTRDRGQGYRATFEGARHALRMMGVTHTDDDAKGFETEGLSESEMRCAIGFAKANAGMKWCVSKWRQEIAGEIGRVCHTIPFGDVRMALDMAGVRPAKLKGTEYGRSVVR